MKRKPRNFGAAWGVVALIVFGGGVGATAWWMAQPAAEGRTARVRVTIARGSSAATVGKLLQSQGVIRSAFAWEKFVARGAKIQPGVYDLDPAETPDRILRHLVRGEVAASRVTFPEGFTLRKIATRLVEKGILTTDAEFLTLATQGGAQFTASIPLPANLEGYLFPDTYAIPAGASAGQIVQLMVSNFDRRVAMARTADLTTRGRSLHEVLTIASMVEREAETDDDRPRIAGVIENRLKKGMRLEIDATVQYARGKHVARLLYRDLDFESPYNTYRHAGLPPGPICCPGLPAIDAALHPTASPFFFYVAGPDGKSHLFSKTFAEHKATIARIRKP